MITFAPLGATSRLPSAGCPGCGVAHMKAVFGTFQETLEAILADEEEREPRLPCPSGDKGTPPGQTVRWTGRLGSVGAASAAFLRRARCGTGSTAFTIPGPAPRGAGRGMAVVRHEEIALLTFARTSGHAGRLRVRVRIPLIVEVQARPAAIPPPA